MERSLLLTIAALVSWTSMASANKEIAGAVVAVAPLMAPPLVQTLKGAAAQVNWRGMTIAPREVRRSSEIKTEISELRRIYLEADFLRCLGMLAQPKLAVDRLLERGAREQAAQVEAWGAACAHGSGDLERARSQIRAALKRDLPIEKALVETRPDFQALVEAERTALQRIGRVAVVVQTRPAGAALMVDGHLRCQQAPCTVRLFPAEHLLTATLPGYAKRTARRQLRRAGTVSLSLDIASAEEAREQLQSLLARGDPGSLEAGRLAANASAAQVVVIAWRDDGKGNAVLYDRRDDKIRARVSIKGGQQGVDQAVRSAAQEWQRIRPKPFYRRAWFYVAVAGTVGLTALVTFLATRSGENRHDLVFQPQ